MPRFRISANGIEIALPGYDVDTAPAEGIAFSSLLPTMRLAQTGVVTAVRYGSSGMASRYARGIVTYDAPFSKPPLVLAAGVVSATESDQKPWGPSSAFSSAAWAWYSVASYSDRFELFLYDRNSGGKTVSRPTRTYRYFVFHNTIDDGS